jgi:hypothetical protein
MEPGRANGGDARLRLCPYSDSRLGPGATKDGALPPAAGVGGELHVAAAARPLPSEGATDDLVAVSAKGARAAGPASADLPPARAALASRLALGPTVLARGLGSISAATAAGADQTGQARHCDTP